MIEIVARENPKVVPVEDMIALEKKALAQLGGRRGARMRGGGLRDLTISVISSVVAGASDLVAALKDPAKHAAKGTFYASSAFLIVAGVAETKEEAICPTWKRAATDAMSYVGHTSPKTICDAAYVDYKHCVYAASAMVLPLARESLKEFGKIVFTEEQVDSVESTILDFVKRALIAGKELAIATTVPGMAAAVAAAQMPSSAAAASAAAPAAAPSTGRRGGRRTRGRRLTRKTRRNH